MSLTLADVEKIAKLSRLTLSDDEKNSTLEKLREDKVTETDHAAEYLAVAPQVRHRMYIVPHVIEE